MLDPGESQEKAAHFDGIMALRHQEEQGVTGGLDMVVQGGKYMGFRVQFIKTTRKRIQVYIPGVGKRFLAPKNLA